MKRKINVYYLVTLLIMITQISNVVVFPLAPSFQIESDKISLVLSTEEEHSLFVVVNGVRSCGGHGKLMQFRYEPCSAEMSICEVPSNGTTFKSELEFIPSRNVNALGIQILVIGDGTITTTFEKPIENSSVSNGQKYMVNVWMGPNSHVKGKSLKIQYMVYRIEDDNLEVCAESELNVV